MTPKKEKQMYEAIEQTVKKSIQLERDPEFNVWKKEWYKKGYKEGYEEEKIEIAKKLKGKMAPEEIAKITGLTLTTVLKL